MNYYAILLFIMFSPWAWLGIAVLLSVFIYANIRFSVANTRNRRLLTPNLKKPRTPEQQAETVRYLKLLPRRHQPTFWFVILLVSGVTLIVLCGLPLLCTYAVHC